MYRVKDYVLQDFCGNPETDIYSVVFVAYFRNLYPVPRTTESMYNCEEHGKAYKQVNDSLTPNLRFSTLVPTLAVVTHF